MRTSAIIFLLVVGFSCSVWAGDTNKTEIAITEHRQKYIELCRDYETNYPAILYDEPRRSALVQAVSRERVALVRLGYLIETNIPYAGEFTNLPSLLDRAQLIDKDFVTLTQPFTTNGLRVTRVTARPDDIQALKKILGVHKGKPPQSSASLEKARKIKLSTVKFDGLPLAVVITMLQDESVKRDAARQGVTISLGSDAKQLADAEINLDLKDVTLEEALERVAVSVGLEVQATDTDLLLLLKRGKQ